MMDTMNCVLFGMNAQVFVVVMHFEGNTTLVILHVELGVVPIMMVGQVNCQRMKVGGVSALPLGKRQESRAQNKRTLAVINGHEPTIVVADDLDEVILKVLDDEEAMVAWSCWGLGYTAAPGKRERGGGVGRVTNRGGGSQCAGVGPQPR